MLVSCLLLAQTAFSQPAIKPLNTPKMQYFSLSDVQLLDGDFKHIQDMTHKYLLTLEPDRLCSWFRREAGLTPKALPYPGWESDHGYVIPGHILGFYLSSMSMMYETSADPEIIKRLEYTLSELNACQDASGDGYLSAVVDGRQVYNIVVTGDYEENTGNLAGKNEPTYIMNKIQLGLYGVYTKCHLPLAKKVLVRMTDWFGENVLNKLDEVGVQKMLICEHGSLSESFMDVYELTGDIKYRDWAVRLNDYRMLIPASEGRDILAGWHANCQIQKFTGFEYVYRFTGDKKYTDAAQFFWERVVADHTWAMGGNSTGEHFFAKSEYDNRVQRNGGPESCNSVNMLRLTEALYQDYAKPEMLDYYERVLINHLLGAYEPERGMVAYMTKLQPGGFKTYSTEYNSFWCCTGTGLESPAKFQKMIYTCDNRSLYVNLFIPSTLEWKAKGVTLRQTTKIPDEEQTSIELQMKKSQAFSLKIRHPYWVESGKLTVTVNGEVQKIVSTSSKFVEINRKWKNGDKIVVQLPMQLSVTPLTPSQKFVSFAYGPVILAAEIDSKDLGKKDYWNEHDNWGLRNTVAHSVPVRKISSLETILNQTKKVSASPLTFKTEGNYTLIPFNRIHYSRYVVYFPVAIRFTSSAAVETGTISVVAAPESYTVYGMRYSYTDKDNVSQTGQTTGNSIVLNNLPSGTTIPVSVSCKVVPKGGIDTVWIDSKVDVQTITQVAFDNYLNETRMFPDPVYNTTALMGTLGVIQIPHILSAAQPCEFPGGDFDYGGDGKAWFKNGRNASGVAVEYRAERGDPGCNVYVGDAPLVNGYVRKNDIAGASSGDWVVYTIEVQDPGEYKVEFAVSTPLTESGAIVTFDALDYTGVVTFPPTPAWNVPEWSALRVPIYFSAGKHKVKFTMEGRECALNFLRFTKI
ncbi:hypothetical protein SAMD00024442_20_1 [Candidatus Symbiothrix dinenymphae]|nr:hypothetical protein SAMD00024442_20_1 [Candidatus Symbiothrix dinenymphae]